MPELLHHLIEQSAQTNPNAVALLYGKGQIDYGSLADEVSSFALGLCDAGIEAGDRVAVYLPKQLETIYGIFGAAKAGAAFVPVNPALKPRQVEHILKHSGARVLLTSAQRLKGISEVLAACPELETIVLVDSPSARDFTQRLVEYKEFVTAGTDCTFHTRQTEDLAAILYTSGSTGNPKGVALSHRNLLVGAQSVAQYLGNTSDDRLLAVLPLSFDAGLSQLTTAFSCGASATLLNYLMPNDVIRAVSQYGITGLAAVPPLWNQLCDLPWPDEAKQSLRYITNTGGAMPVTTTRSLQAALADTKIFLMYGLTEAFRSTYLPPSEVSSRPESIGKAIPNAEIYIIDSEGEECAANVPGELVHCGPLVSMGYWQDNEATAQRFKSAPRVCSSYSDDLAVWSGDSAYKDEQGYLYFVGRNDEMIKTSGYRVSPNEVEDIAMDSQLFNQVVALGLPHAALGQAILLVGAPKQPVDETDTGAILKYCQKEMPSFMVPGAIVLLPELPLNQNGKIDRTSLRKSYQNYFSGHE